ncbi:MAG: hypothetical protein ACK4SY_08330 [Pyrobaculum sp.]
MEYRLDVLTALGLEGEPLTEDRFREFQKVKLVEEELVAGQYIDFGTVKIRHEGGGTISFAKTWHVFLEAISLKDGESFLIYCTCPMVDRFVVLKRVGEKILLLYRPRPQS